MANFVDEETIITKGADKEVVNKFITRHRFPSHLNCPYCPAQAMSTMDGLHYIMNNVQFRGGLRLKLYACPSNHMFYIEPEKEKVE